MNKEQMDKLLVMAVEKYEILVIKSVLKKIPSQSVYKELAVGKTDFVRLKNKLLLVGRILEVNEKDRILIAAVDSGIGNANPCIMVVLMEEESVFIDAFAVEGLIKQRTARNAVDSLCKKLQGK